MPRPGRDRLKSQLFELRGRVPRRRAQRQWAGSAWLLQAPLRLLRQVQENVSQPGFNVAVQQVIDAIAEGFRERTEANVAALRSAGRLSWDGLVAALADRSAGDDRQRAAWLLGRLGRAGALAPLQAALADDDAGLRAEAARALGSLAHAAAIDPLARALRHDLDTNVRAAAAWALGLIGDAGGIDPLLAALDDGDEDPAVRGHAAEALTGPRDSRVIPHLIAGLADRSPEVRYWCAFAAGELGAIEALPALEHLAATDRTTAANHGPIADEARAAIALIRGGG